MKPLLIVGGGGLILYYLYSKGYLSSLMGSTTTTTGTPVTTPPANTNPPANTPPPNNTMPNFNSLASIYQRLLADAGPSAVANGLTPDGWNFSLQRVSSINPAPDPAIVFPGVDRTQLMTAAQYWSGMSAYLKANMGMSGIGLGGFNFPLGWA